jgi:hypothetical protein
MHNDHAETNNNTTDSGGTAVDDDVVIGGTMETACRASMSASSTAWNGFVNCEYTPLVFIMITLTNHHFFLAFFLTAYFSFTLYILPGPPTSSTLLITTFL